MDRNMHHCIYIFGFLLTFNSKSLSDWVKFVSSTLLTVPVKQILCLLGA